MSQRFSLQDGGFVVERLIETIEAHKVYLSEIDGAIGDGDHGINMSKGFTQAGARIRTRTGPVALFLALEDLALTLLEGIGGSMGPLYGGFFLAFSETLEGHDSLNASLFLKALEAGTTAVQEVGGAEVGDKTLMDTLIPALETYRTSLTGGESFESCLERMVQAARVGWESTRDMQARVGRASRLGVRSIGVLDAGATSCFLILECISKSIRQRLASI